MNSARRVLLVDDDPIQRKAGALRLRSLGYQVTTALDGMDALDALHRAPIDGVISDVLMPRLDGFCLCAAIRRDAAIALVPVILASSNYIEDSDRVVAERMGASGFVLREPDLASAIAALEAQMARPRAGRSRLAAAESPEHHARVVHQLERQAAINVAFAHTATMQSALLAVVAAMSEVLSRHPDVAAAFPELLGSLLDASDISRGALFSIAADGELALAAALGFGHQVTTDLREFCGQRAMFEGAIASRTPYAIVDDAGDLLARLEARTALAIPLVSGDECLGLFLLVSRDRDLTDPEWIAFARVMAVQIGQALALGRTEASLRRSDAQLRQTQKMEAVGALASGIAHDFNNALSVVLSYCDLMLDGLGPDEPMREDIEAICTAGRGAAALTRQLLMFSRKQIVEPLIVDINEALLGLDRVLQRVVGVDIRLVLIPTEAVGLVRIDPGSIEQVVMNLVINARDAMPTGGTLTIETANVVLDEPGAKLVGLAPGAHILLTVSDTGIGMDGATRARIFEAFFTTKGPGKGTGLGLSTVFGIVEQARGKLGVDSEPGRGTVFKIYLPRADRDANQVVAKHPAMLPAARGTEKILLVEDTDQVRSVAAIILRRQGYSVIEARNAGEAMLLIESAVPIDLLLTDVEMPQMSGPSLARRIAADRPDLKILCMSGCVDDGQLGPGIVEGRLAYLHKPFTPDSLATKVREVLDAS